MFMTVYLFIMTSLAIIFVTPFGIVSFFLQWFGLKKPMSYVSYRIAQFWALSVKFFCRCPIEVRGKENIPKKGGVCFVSNHESIFDIVLVLSYIGRPFGFIAKKELMWVPLLNLWIYLIGGLFIDRNNARKAFKTINEGIRRLKKGGSMLIFPEGHRSTDGKLLPFRAGALKLATQAEVPIIPISIRNSGSIYEKTGRYQRASMRVVFGKPISSTELKKQELADYTQQVVADGLK